MTKLIENVNLAGMPADGDPKRETILTAAFAQFSRYGFRRTSMEDIASEAGVSRASLYSYFDNKEEIFRSLSAALHDRAIDEAERHLEGVESARGTASHLSSRVAAALIAKIGPFHAILTQSAHGSEIADENNQRCGDVVRDSRQRFQALLAKALRVAARDGQIDLKQAGLSANVAAQLIYFGAVGLKQDAMHKAAFEKKLRDFARVFLRGLS